MNKALLLLTILVVMFMFTLADANARGEECGGSWDCSWDERCVKPKYGYYGTCVKK